MGKLKIVEKLSGLYGSATSRHLVYGYCSIKHIIYAKYVIYAKYALNKRAGILGEVGDILASIRLRDLRILYHVTNTSLGNGFIIRNSPTIAYSLVTHYVLILYTRAAEYSNMLLS